MDGIYSAICVHKQWAEGWFCSWMQVKELLPENRNYYVWYLCNCLTEEVIFFVRRQFNMVQILIQFRYNGLSWYVFTYDRRSESYYWSRYMRVSILHYRSLLNCEGIIDLSLHRSNRNTNWKNIKLWNT